MRRQSAGSPVTEIACPACDAMPDERSNSGRYPSGRPMTSASQFHPARTAAAASA